MKKILYLASIVICILVIRNLAMSIYDLWHKQDLLVSAQKELDKEKEENQNLKAKLKYVSSNEFIESEARNDLFLLKPGESGVIIPSDLISKKSTHSEPKLENWQKWLKLFGL